MKRILIVNNNMHIGGVQKALVNLLHEIENDYDVTLLLFYAGGSLMNQIPSHVKVITPDSPFRYWGMTREDTITLREQAGRAFWAGFTRTAGKDRALRLIYPFQKMLQGYDVAISFLHSGAPYMFYGGCNEFVLYCVDAKKKITFLHCDFGKIHADTEENARIYQGFDRIAACSEGCKQAFLKVMPQFVNKTVVVPNCQNYAEIIRLAQSGAVSLNKDRLNVVTVSRFGKEKGILRAIQAIASLGEQMHRICYYIIGTGADFPRAKAMISELHLQESVFLLGEMENPYGYMRAADVLLIPSVSEAAPLVISEAASLGTPVLTTETSSAREMVADTGLGWVCENSVHGIKTGLKWLLIEPCKIKEKKVFIRRMKFNNAVALERFSELVT